MLAGRGPTRGSRPLLPSHADEAPRHRHGDPPAVPRRRARRRGAADGRAAAAGSRSARACRGFAALERGPAPCRPRPDRRRLGPGLLHRAPFLAGLRPRPRPGGRRRTRPGSDLRGGLRGDPRPAGRRFPPRGAARRSPPATPPERGPARPSTSGSPGRPRPIEADRDGVPAIDVGSAALLLAPGAASLARRAPEGEPGSLVYGRLPAAVERFGPGEPG